MGIKLGQQSIIKVSNSKDKHSNTSPIAAFSVIKLPIFNYPKPL